MLLFGDGVVVVGTCVLIVFVILEVVNFGQVSLAGLGDNYCLE